MRTLHGEADYACEEGVVGLNTDRACAWAFPLDPAENNVASCSCSYSCSMGFRARVGARAPKSRPDYSARQLVDRTACSRVASGIAVALEVERRVLQAVDR